MPMPSEVDAHLCGRCLSLAGGLAASGTELCCHPAARPAPTGGIVPMKVEKLDGLICGTWSSRSISAHNQITDIRALIGLLGGDFLSLDADAVEIEAIVAIAMGVENEFLTTTEMS